MTNDQLNAAVATGPMGFHPFKYLRNRETGWVRDIVTGTPFAFRPATDLGDNERLKQRMRDLGWTMKIVRPRCGSVDPITCDVYRAKRRRMAGGSDPTSEERAVCLAAIEAVSRG